MTLPNRESRSQEVTANQKLRGTGLTSQVSPWLGALLGEVISQTDQLIESDQSSEAGHPESLQRVAEKFKGKELTVDPIMLELVEAVISDLAARINQEALRKKLVRHVAETLHEDPAAYQRISSLWENLQRRLT